MKKNMKMRGRERGREGEEKGRGEPGTGGREVKSSASPLQNPGSATAASGNRMATSVNFTCPKCISIAPDPTGGAYSAPPDP